MGAPFPAEETEPMADESPLDELVGCEVVLDVRGPYIYLGTLERVETTVFVLTSADVHFTDEDGPSGEVYIRDAAVHGIYPTRERVYVMRDEVVSISLVSDVIGT
jgi:hypothetical protein